MANSNPENRKEQKQSNEYIKYSGLAIQMAVTIYLGHLLGTYLDDRSGNTNDLYAKIITLVAVFLSIFLVIRQVMKKQ